MQKDKRKNTSLKFSAPEVYFEDASDSGESSVGISEVNHH